MGLIKEWETWSCWYGGGREDGEGQLAVLGRGRLDNSGGEGLGWPSKRQEV